MIDERIQHYSYSLGNNLPIEFSNLKIERIIHLAWEGLPNYDSNIHLEQIQHHIKLLKQFAVLGCRHIYVAGTCFEYFKPQGCISERHQIESETKYGEAKIILRESLGSIVNELSVNLVWMRLFYIYGLKQRENTLIGGLLKAIQNNDPIFKVESKSTTLDFTEVSEIAGKIVRVVMNPEIQGDINIASGKPTTVGSLVREIAAEENSEIRIYEKSPRPVKCFWADTSKYESYFH